MSGLPDGAILDDEEPQQWHAQPHTQTPDEADQQAEAEGAEQGEEGDEEGDDGDDDLMGEEGDGEEPWMGVHAAAADPAAAEADYAEHMADEEVEDEEEEAALPEAGDLTAAFFSEMAANQSSRGRGHSNKRHRGGGANDGDSSDDDYGVVQSRAFAIPSHLLKSFDPSNTAPPATAEEYLLRVRMEADACPRIKVSNIDPRAYVHRQTAYLPNLGLVPRPANPTCLPSEEWQNHFAADFAEARQQLLCFAANNSSLRKVASHSTPSKRDYPAWIQYCLGDVHRQLDDAAAAFAVGASAAAASTAAPAAVQPCLPHCPSLPLVVAMDQIQTKGILVQLLQFGTDLIQQRRHQSEQAQHRATATAQPAPQLAPFPFPSHAYTLWLHTLLLKLDKPIQSHVAASMRAAFRALSWMRAHDNSPGSDTVKFTNVLLTILDRSFGQRVEFTNQ